MPGMAFLLFSAVGVAVYHIIMVLLKNNLFVSLLYEICNCRLRKYW